MTTFYLTAVPTEADALRFKLLKAVRDAMRVIHPEAAATDAQVCIDACRVSGWGILGTTEADQATIDRMRMEINDLFEPVDAYYGIDIDTDRHERRHASKRDQRDGLTPEQQFAKHAPGEPPAVTESPAPVMNPRAYETAMALLASSEGNPIAAAGVALNLARTTRDEALYHETIRCLIAVFPWIEVPLQAAGLWD